MAKFDFDFYLHAGFQLTPLAGKRPIIRNWTKRTLDRKQLIQLAKKEYNFGALLRAEHIVIDVDPRNFKDANTWTRFVELYNLEALLDKAPTVKTGGDGFHFYFSKPKSINIIETLDGFEGIEFKSDNRQVVIPGSIHPDSLNPYVWVKNSQFLSALPQIPTNILTLITRPQLGTDSFSLAGQFSIEEIANILDALDVTKYRDHDEWFRIMVACHHASAGRARQEFINWSTSDLQYKNHDHNIGMRWDSLHFSSNTEITYRTLRYELKKIGRLDVIRSLYSNAHDLPTEITVDLGFIRPDSTEQMGPFEFLNHNYCSVMASSRAVLYHSRESDSTQWATTSRTAFEQQYGDLQVEIKGRTRPISLIKAWYQWRYHRKAVEAVLDVEGKHKDNPRILNLWRGWATKPNGSPDLSWDYLDMLIKYGLTSGNEEYYKYVLDWTAFMFQQPYILPETALVFTGKKGTGKSTFGKVLDKIVGQTHSIHVTSPEVFTGRFNAHMENRIFVFADEAVSQTSEAHNSRLKALITEQNATVEAKGIDARRIRNHAHVVISSNNAAPVKISPDERRYAMFEVEDVYRGDFEFFNNLYTQMENGGYEKFMFDMMMRPIDNWHPRINVPMTVSLVDQKLAAMDPVEEWWVSVLNYESAHPSNITLNRIDTSNMTPEQITAIKTRFDWSTAPCRVFRDELKILFIDYLISAKTAYSKGHSSFSNHIFWRRMRDLTAIPSTSEKQPYRDYISYADPQMQLRLEPIKEPHAAARAHSVELPSLKECRKIMDNRYQEPFKWVDPIEATQLVE